MRELFGDSLRRTAENNDGVTMKDKCAVDFKLFCEYYLKDSFRSPWSRFHIWMMEKLQTMALEQPNMETRDVTAAPRGHAKSTVASFAYPIWNALYGYRKFIVIISDTTPVAKQFLVDIRNELEFNDRIKRDFGEVKDDTMWNTSELLLTNRTYITARGAGTQMRGMKFNSTRPDLVLIDDLEDKETVSSATQNAALAEWFNSDVMPMGAPYCHFFMVGTVLSYESLLYHMLNDARYSAWTRKTFKAVEKFSTSHLWAEWEAIMTDLSRGDSAYKDATKFYEKHKKEMLEGTEVLWPDQRPDMYKHLMERKLESEDGFASEFQNDPQTEKTRLFKEEWLENDLYDNPPKIKEVCIAIDPAVASKRNNDYSVVTVVGRGEDNYFYVLECDAQKRTAERLIENAEAIIAMYYSFKPRIVCETNAMQQFFSTTLQRSLVQKGIYLEWIEVNHGPNINKGARIESLMPHIKQGHIRFKKDQRILLNQLKNYPKAHDDAPDCLEMAVKPMLSAPIAQFGFGSIGSRQDDRKGGAERAAMERIKKAILSSPYRRGYETLA